MFYKNTLSSPKKNKKTLKFNVFDEKILKNEENAKFNSPAQCYNFSLDGGVLSAGYGVKDLAMPTSTEDLDNDVQIPIIGKVQRMWSFTWYNTVQDILNYYLFYFNDENKFYYENLFWIRPIRLDIDTTYKSTPVGMSYRINGEDYMIFSSKDGDVYVYGSGYNKNLPDAPKLISLCSHEERVYALTSAERHSLVYSDNENIFEWNDETCTHLDFSDERGNLNKVLSFNEYLYIFRDFGITRLSQYSTSGEFSIRHMYMSTSYIYPGSIAYDGENVYFMTDDGFYKFDGNNVKKINFENHGLHLENCSAACFESKYFLACRKDYTDRVGCESGQYVNNVVLIYHIHDDKFETLRGLDVKQVLALLNPHKSKLVMCFNGGSDGRIGELVKGEKLFDQPAKRCWQSVLSDLNLGQADKKLEAFYIKTSDNVTVTFEGDKQSKSFTIKAGKNVQRIKCGLIFKTIKVGIETESEDIKISDFQIEVSVQ